MPPMTSRRNRFPSGDPRPWDHLPVPPDQLGLLIVDHGSRRGESNDLLVRIVQQIVGSSPFSIVEPAHMEIAQPSLGTAFDRCVARGARLVVVFPYFLAPGRHWADDIPRLTAEAAQRHTGVSYLVTAPLGLHPLIVDLIQARVGQCLSHAAGQTDGCELCEETDACQWR